MGQTEKPWFVYLVRCSDGSIYTGISKTVTKRIATHNAGKGATYTAQRRPVSLLYQESHPDQGSALRREAQIKKWRKGRKEALVVPDHSKRRGRLRKRGEDPLALVDQFKRKRTPIRIQ